MTEDIRLDPESLRKILAMAKASGKVMKAEVYKGLRASAEPAAEAARQAILGASPPKADQTGRIGRALGHHRFSSRTQHTGLREGIAKGISIGVRTGTNAGVRITSSDRALPANQKRMNRTFTDATFRHPVFGSRKKVPQHGEDWFVPPIRDKKDIFGAAVLAAMEAAAQKLGEL